MRAPPLRDQPVALPPPPEARWVDQPVHLAQPVAVERVEPQQLDAAGGGGDAAAHHRDPEQDGAGVGQVRPDLHRPPVVALEAGGGQERQHGEEAAPDRLQRRGEVVLPVDLDRADEAAQEEHQRSPRAPRSASAAPAGRASPGSRPPRRARSSCRGARPPAAGRARSPARRAGPTGVPSSPPTGEMPLVESVAIAWQTATNGAVAGEDQEQRQRAGEAGIDRRDHAGRSAGCAGSPPRRCRCAAPRAGPAPAWPISKPPRLSGARIAKAVTSTISPPIQPTSARQRCSGSGEQPRPVEERRAGGGEARQHLEVAAAEPDAGHQRHERRRQHQRQQHVGEQQRQQVVARRRPAARGSSWRGRG